MAGQDHHKDWLPGLTLVLSILFFPIVIILALLMPGKRK